MADWITVDLVYPLKEKQEIFTVRLPEGATIAQAIESSEILLKYPQIDLSKNKLGVFSKLSKLDTPLRDKDRVEIYRPLIADPKEVRKQRAAEGKAMKKGAGETSGEK
ncbi:MAG: RnfH family protein [Candidatus Accumulibacter sp.]|jgi:putative ubiquitin-RnfH superfamily antitoxin RatB of RatAB toxin-antitoxin module|nr:RnfH family protein [Accumulibacter sp.]